MLPSGITMRKRMTVDTVPVNTAHAVKGNESTDSFENESVDGRGGIAAIFAQNDNKELQKNIMAKVEKMMKDMEEKYSKGDDKLLLKIVEIREKQSS